MESMGSGAAQTGILDTLKDTLNPTTLMKRLNLTQELLLSIILYLGIGFAVGFLLKKYSNAITIILACIGLLALAHYFDLVSITVYWNKIQEIFGYQQLEPVEGSMLSAYWLWVKTHVALVVSFAIGFLFGVHMA